MLMFKNMFYIQKNPKELLISVRPILIELNLDEDEIALGLINGDFIVLEHDQMNVCLSNGAVELIYNFGTSHIINARISKSSMNAYIAENDSHQSAALANSFEKRLNARLKSLSQKGVYREKYN